MLLKDVISRRGDWSMIPVVSAELAEQELAQGGFTEDETRAREDSIINSYLQAIELGRRGTAVVRRTVQLLFKNGRGSDVLDLLSSIPIESVLGSDLGHQAAVFAVDNRDYRHAEQIARKAVEAKPDDFQARVWLVRVLLASEHQAQAEKELRNAVNLDTSDPTRWDVLLGFMILTKQPGQAAKVIEEAEAKLPRARAPMALARSCATLSVAYMGGGNEAEAKKWNDTAKVWYEKAQAAQPGDLSVKRSLAEFLLRSKQFDEAEKCLDAIRTQGEGAKNAETARWANRTLALVLASRGNPTQLSKALALFEPTGKLVPAGQEGKNLTDPADQRALVHVLDMQKTLVHRKRAIEILKSLADKSVTIAEDRFILARLYEAIGDWPSAREKYRELDRRTANDRAPETLNRRPFYLAEFADGLLRHRKSDDKEDLDEAQSVAEELKKIQPEAIGTLSLQVRIHAARNEFSQVVALIKAFAGRPNLAPAVIGSLANLAESVKQFPLADELYRQQATLAGTPRNQVVLATFLGRQGQVKKGLDLCEPLWKSGRDLEVLAVTNIDILFGSEDNPHTPEPAEIKRVADWIEEAIARTSKQGRPNPLLFVGLGNLRERQGLYPEAERLYNLAIQAGDKDGISSNNLAWLAALKDKRYKEALQYANRAIKLKPDQPDFLDTRGMIYLLDGQSKLGLDDLQKAVAFDPSSPSKLFHLTQAYLANDEIEKARQTLGAAKAKGFSPNGLHVLERETYQQVLEKLESR